MTPDWHDIQRVLFYNNHNNKKINKITTRCKTVSVTWTFIQIYDQLRNILFFRFCQPLFATILFRNPVSVRYKHFLSSKNDESLRIDFSVRNSFTTKNLFINRVTDFPFHYVKHQHTSLLNWACVYDWWLMSYSPDTTPAGGVLR